MTPDEADRSAASAIETLVATRRGIDLLQLRLVLSAIDLAPFNVLVGGGWRSFRGSDQAGREALLRGWSTSWLPPIRTAFQVLKRFALFLAYAEPGPDEARPSNPRWPALAYEPQPMPAATPLVVATPVRDDDGLTLRADAVVVGSGAGGGVVAARLATAGLDVIVLEAAAELPEPEMRRLEALAWRDAYLDRGTTATDDLAVTILAGSSVGGGTTVNWTTSLAPPDWLRDEWEEVHGLDGMTGAETDADIARLRSELDLQPPTVVPPKDRLILDGAATLGWEASTTERNAGPCTECGACGFGCPSGAKRSARRVHLAAAQGAGARIVAGARVTHLDLRRPLRVVHGQLTDGRAFAVHAPRVIVAAGPLRTPAILAASGVGHPQLGRNLRLHPVALVAALLPHPVDMWRGPTQAARSLEFWRPGGRAADGSAPAHHGFVIESAPGHPGLAASALPWSGRAAAASLLARLRHLAPLIAIVRDVGSGEVRARRDGSVSIRYRLAAPDRATAHRAIVELARLGHAGGADELIGVATPAHHWRRPEPLAPFLAGLAAIDGGPNRIGLFSAHQMGTARAGAVAADHPCDPAGRVRIDAAGHLVNGVYCADASLFPSASGVNPMLTVMTLAERTARAVLADV
jgi:choline dehydrogenase-like flavoprotein